MDLTTAIMIAAEMHEGQTDKAGEPYILHPLRVMLSLTDEDERIVGVLHDVAEDNEDGWDRIHDAGFSDKIIQAIDGVTRRSDETYEAFIRRCSENALAARVKIADIKDNLRDSGLPHAEASRLRQRYLAALQALTATTMR